MSIPPTGAFPLTHANHRPGTGAMVLFAMGVATVWVALFQLNDLLFSELNLTGFITWIFLPAAIRMFAVMIGGWAGALGLFVGAILTNLSLLEVEPLNAMVIAALSALGPVIAVHLCTRWLQLPGDLAGLQRSHLLVFALAGAVFNVFPHNLFFYTIGLSHDAWSGVLPMFVGDLSGTLVVLYLASFSIRIVAKSVRV
jgi:hypothetical protein